MSIGLALYLGAPAWAGWEEAEDAYVRGDYATALSELGPLAEQGDAGAQNLLGLMYTLGQGTLVDHGEAFGWYRRAAAQGNVEAQWRLGVMYRNGSGVPGNDVQAHMWFTLAAARGSDIAKRLVDDLAARMTPAGIEEARRRAREWRPKEPAQTWNPTSPWGWVDWVFLPGNLVIWVLVETIPEIGAWIDLDSGHYYGLIAGILSFLGWQIALFVVIGIKRVISRD